MELNIGSNIFRNANGVLKLEGKEQIRVVEIHWGFASTFFNRGSLRCERRAGRTPPAQRVGI